MQKSCNYCGSIHDEDFKCPKKPKIQYKITEIRQLRASSKWANLSKKIKQRDKYLCQLCLLENKYTYNNLEVHHIVSLADNPSLDLAFEPSNLITLCSYHHRLCDLPDSNPNKIVLDKQTFK